MSQVFKDEKVVPVTLIKAGPIVISQIRTREKDGYEAIQVAFNSGRKKINKPLRGHLNNLKSGDKEIKVDNLDYLKEFRISSVNDYKVGDQIDVSVFEEGDKVIVTSKSKGRGFQGVVKRYGFHGGPKTHGQKNRLRAPGSIGATTPQRVVRGKKMPGRMGNNRKTIKNLEVIQVDKENNILAVKGAVPGMRGALVEVRKIEKKK